MKIDSVLIRKESLTYTGIPKANSRCGKDGSLLQVAGMGKSIVDFAARLSHLNKYEQ